MQKYSTVCFPATANIGHPKLPATPPNVTNIENEMQIKVKHYNAKEAMAIVTKCVKISPTLPCRPAGLTNQQMEMV